MVNIFKIQGNAQDYQSVSRNVSSRLDLRETSTYNVVHVCQLNRVLGYKQFCYFWAFSVQTIFHKIEVDEFENELFYATSWKQFSKEFAYAIFLNFAAVIKGYGSRSTYVQKLQNLQSWKQKIAKKTEIFNLLQRSWT